MARQIRNCTYRNMMIIVNRIQRKGWDFDESVRLARGIFAHFEACPNGLSVEQLERQIITVEEWKAENA